MNMVWQTLKSVMARPTDDFSTINWGDDKYFIQVSLDPTGGTSYEFMGTSQLLSVPYALHAGTADTVMMESQTLSISGDTLSIRDGNSVVLPSEGTITGQGNLIFILSGNITDAEASQMIADEVGSNTRYIRIENTSQLTNIDLSGVKDLIELNVVSNESLSNIIIGDLETGRDLVFADCPLLTTINLESLSTYVYLQVNCKELNNLNISNLTFISDLNFSSCHALTTLDISKLVASRDFQIIKSGLESIQISNLSEIGSFVLSYNKLTSESVNYLLAHFVSISPIISGKDIHLIGQTPPAPPTGQGIIDKATLEANGNSIYTD